MLSVICLPLLLIATATVTADSCFEAGKGYAGNDIKHVPESESPADCQVRCQNTEGCVAWTHDTRERHKNSPASYKHKGCWLHHAEGRRWSSPDAVSGPRDCPTEAPTTPAPTTAAPAPGLGDRCRSTRNAPKCAAANSWCSAYKCECMPGFIADGQECVVEPEVPEPETAGLAHGERCNSRSPPCGEAFTDCITYRCKCIAGYERSDDECVPQDTLPLLHRCSVQGAPCADANSECSAYRCFCKAGFPKKGVMGVNGLQCDAAAPEPEVEPTTVAPTTVAPTTVAPTTVAPTTVAPTTVAPTEAPEATHACGKKLRCKDKSQYCSGGFWTSHKCKSLRAKGKFCTSSRQCLSKTCKWAKCK